MRAGADFFRVTKRIHNFLHGHRGDSGPLGAAQRRAYERVIDDAGWALRDVIGSGDVVVLHDPQTLGLAGGLKRLGATVIWRCHIGTDRPGGLAEAAWDFLWPYVQQQPDVAVFSRRASAPARLPMELVRVIVPSIDPCSVKNADMSSELAAAILEYTGLVEVQASCSGRRRLSGLTVLPDGSATAAMCCVPVRPRGSVAIGWSCTCAAGIGSRIRSG